MPKLVLVLVLVLGAARAARAQEARPSGCVECHAKEAEAEKGTPHARGAVACEACHGGDPAARGAAAAKGPGTGYRGKIPRAAFPETCGTCHADVRRMNPTGLPTDALARYRTSHHGEAVLLRGDDGAATCVDCHGAHGILGPRDARSPVHARNVPETCGRCHADAEKMGPREMPSDDLRRYRESVHGALLAKGDLAAPT
ncbi:MAG: cytochrome c3 family protein, partial [Planctomycetales bacterium]|nr:cytochrome c3 family protein [Planctomycetales bacterium]